MKVLYIVNSTAFFCSHFMSLAVSTMELGHKVYVVAGDVKFKREIEIKGFIFFSFGITRSGVNPIEELFSIFKLYKYIRNIRPDLMHMFSIKPVIYGCLLNKLFKRSRVSLSVASITGLGSVSLATDGVGKLLWFAAKCLYRFVFSVPSTHIVFENNDDQDLFVASGIIQEKRSSVVNGAGVDTRVFCPSIHKVPYPMTVVLVARLLKDKGVREYIEAGKLLKEKGIGIKLQLVGPIDVESISSIKIEDINFAHERGYVEYLGEIENVADVYQKAHIACLPSYREGLPKSLIEGSSCGLAIVTTDVPGCRQLVFGGENGVLIQPRSADSIAIKLEYLCAQPLLVEIMGKVSREKALELYDHAIIERSFFEIYGIN